MAEAASIGDALQILGDPSGRQDSDYWNAWFKAVCLNPEHRVFEWYCSTNEVIRVLSNYIGDANILSDRHRIMHPGSGTSLLPVRLSQIYPYRNVVVDVSEVAIDEMKQLHRMQFEGVNQGTKAASVEYRVANLLEPALDFEANSFHFWIDKGFVDAVFSKEGKEVNRSQEDHLFLEINRVLTSEGGTALIVSLAEDHSLQLIVNNWLRECIAWKDRLDVWELTPVSGDMPPFCFVLAKASGNAAKNGRRVNFHYIHSKSPEEIYVNDAEEGIAKIGFHISQSRAAFAQRLSSPNKPKISIRRILAILEIKPYDADMDLKVLANVIQSTVWKMADKLTILPQWYPFPGGDLQKIVPVAYGISKLQLKCIIPEDDIDKLVEAINEWEGNDQFSDGVQSVDVDWANTVPVGDAIEILRNR
jgi:translation elongation factor EF-1beta